LLGLVATQSIDAMLGSLISNSRGAGYISVPVMGLIAISGIFPIYWLGLGMRSALLPDSAVSIETGHSWRHLDPLRCSGPGPCSA
jgi:ABC-2 type transport system permease protein